MTEVKRDKRGLSLHVNGSRVTLVAIFNTLR